MPAKTLHGFLEHGDQGRGESLSMTDTLPDLWGRIENRGYLLSPRLDLLR